MACDGAAMRGTAPEMLPDLPDVGLAAGRSVAGSLSYPFSTTKKALVRAEDKIKLFVLLFKNSFFGGSVLES